MSALLTKPISDDDPRPVMPGCPCCLERARRIEQLEQTLRAEREREEVRGELRSGMEVIMCCRGEGRTGRTISLWVSWLPARTRYHTIIIKMMRQCNVILWRLDASGSEKWLS